MAAIAIELASAYVSILPETSKIAPGVRKAFGEVDREADRAGKSSGGAMSRALGGALKVGAAAAGGAAVAGIGVAMAKGFSRLTAIDDARGKLRGLGKDTAEVDKIMASALASVKGTAFGLGDAATVAASTVAAGIKPGKDLERTLKLVGDAATIGGSSMGEMGAIFNKVAASNKLQAEEMNQLMDRGIPIQSLLASHLKVSATEVRKLASDGKISFADFQAAMEAGLGGAALESGSTFTGAMQNVGAAIGRLGAEFLGPAFQQMPNLFAGAITAIDGLAPAVKGLGENFGGMLQRVTSGAGTVLPALRSMGETVAPLGAALGNVLAVVAPLAEQLAKLAVAAIVVAWRALQGALDAVVPAIVSLTGWLRENEGAVRALTVAVVTGVAAWKSFQAALAIQAVVVALTSAHGKLAIALKIAAVAQQAMNVAMRANPIGIVITALAALAAALAYAWNNSETFRRVVTAAWNGVRAAVGAVVGWFTGTVAPFFTGLWDRLASGARAGSSAFTRAWDTVRTFFADLWGRIADPVRRGLQAIADFALPWVRWFTAVFSTAWAVIRTLIEIPVRAAWMGLQVIWDGIKAVFTAVAAWAGRVFAAAWAPIREHIVAPVTRAWERVTQVWASIRAVFTAAWQWVAGVFAGWWRTLTAIIGAVMDAVRARISSVWAAIRAVFSTAWQWVTSTFRGWWNGLTALMSGPIDAARNLLSTALDRIKSSFKSAVDWIRDMWGRLDGIIKAPVRLAIRALNALLGAFRKLGSAVGIKESDLPKDIPTPPGFIHGGVLPGAGTSAGDDMLVVDRHGRPRATVASGEPVLSRAMYARNRAAVDAILRGQRLPGYFRGGFMPTPGPVRPHRLPYYGAQYAADMGYGTGSPVYAWKDGIVASTVRANTSYGNRIRINHSPGQTLYAHLSAFNVAAGQLVKAGQLIGRIGYSGNVQPKGPGGAHLHWEILGGAAQNTGDTGTDDGGGFFDPIGMITSLLGDNFTKLRELGDSPFVKLVKGIPETLLAKLVDKVKGVAGDVLGRIFGTGDTPTGSLGSGVERWRPNVIAALAREGLPTTEAYISAWMRQIRTESGGDPNAVQKVRDVNWPNNKAVGLVQVIPGTFAAHRNPALPNNRMNPDASLSAGMRYARSRYGAAGMLRAVGQGRGYWQGTRSARPGLAWVGERGRELIDFRGGERVYSNPESEQIAAGNRYYFQPQLRQGESDLRREMESFVWRIEQELTA